MILYLARHAQTNYNVAKLCNADPSVDVHLTESGIQQAGQLASMLSSVDFDVVIISELRRTRQTAEIVNEHHNKPVIVDKRMNDNSTGFEGKPVQDWLDALDESEDRWTVKFNGGESLEQARQRVYDFLEDLKTKPYGAVLVVTSGYATQCVYGILNGLTSEQATEYQLEQGKFAEFNI